MATFAGPCELVKSGRGVRDDEAEGEGRCMEDGRKLGNVESLGAGPELLEGVWFVCDWEPRERLEPLSDISTRFKNRRKWSCNGSEET